jgi:hypothetical protein
VTTVVSYDTWRCHATVDDTPSCHVARVNVSIQSLESKAVGP